MRIALALAFVLVGCVASNPSDTDTDTDTDTGSDTGDGSDSGSGSGSGSDTDTEATPPVASGAYQVRSDIDLTVEALLPEQPANMVVTLRDFSTNPARTLFDLAEDAGVPAVQEIRDALPGYVEDKLEGWLNGELNKLTLDGVPVPQVAGNIAALAETALTQFALDSELTIAGSTATHTLKAIDLAPAGITTRYVIESLPSDIITATTACSTSAGSLTLGDHGYALQYGEYLWRALNQAVTAQYGSDIRTALGAAVNCPALAQTIANKCYLGYCVGHAAELTEICEAGLDEVVERVHDEFLALRFDALHFAAGTATMVDADEDGTVEALTAGVWDAEINAGLGLRHVPATFTATK